MKIQRQKLPYKILMQLAKTKNVFQIVAENTYTPIKKSPIIFAVNHSNCYDVPITATAVGRHVYVLVGKQRLGLLDRFFFSLNGIVYADRMSKIETSEAKKAIINLLKKGHAICWYPEGTWNLTDNLLVLPLKWGIIEVANQAGAQIIPVGLNYDRDKKICRVKFGIPMAGQSLENKSHAIEELRDAMATLQWDLMNCSPLIRKEKTDKEKLKRDIVCAIEEYPPLEPEYEKQCIYWPNSKIDTVPPAIIPCLKNAFLFNKRLSG